MEIETEDIMILFMSIIGLLMFDIMVLQPPTTRFYDIIGGMLLMFSIINLIKLT